MEPRAHFRQDSWLSLVAETAGVARCSIARVEIVGHPGFSGEARLCVQVLGAYGDVLGATTWHGDVRELGRGFALDLGYGSDLDGSGPTEVVAWLDWNDVGADPFFCETPAYATREPFSETGVTHLELGRGFHVAA